jgi:hypothetical protein
MPDFVHCSTKVQALPHCFGHEIECDIDWSRDLMFSIRFMLSTGKRIGSIKQQDWKDLPQV